MIHDDGLKPAMLMPKGALDGKPAHGQPCNNCGLCCMATLCPLGRRLFKRELGPCPALLKNGGGCGVVANPAVHAPVPTMIHGADAMRSAARHLIGANMGCDARFNGEPVNLGFYGAVARYDAAHRTETRTAKRLWGIT